MSINSNLFFSGKCSYFTSLSFKSVRAGRAGKGCPDLSLFTKSICFERGFKRSLSFTNCFTKAMISSLVALAEVGDTPSIIKGANACLIFSDLSTLKSANILPQGSSNSYCTL